MIICCDTRVLDNVQMGILTSAKSAQYVQMLLLGPKQMSGIPWVGLIFEGWAYGIPAEFNLLATAHKTATNPLRGSSIVPW